MSEIITIFSALCDFVLESKAEIATKVIASATYDGLKTVLDFNSLKAKIKRFFSKEEDADKYIMKLCNTPSQNQSDPEKELLLHYQGNVDEKGKAELVETIKGWIKHNEEAIRSINVMNFTNSNGFNIGIQKARKNIFNIQGDFVQKKKKKKS